MAEAENKAIIRITADFTDAVRESDKFNENLAEGQSQQIPANYYPAGDQNESSYVPDSQEKISSAVGQIDEYLKKQLSAPVVRGAGGTTESGQEEVISGSQNVIVQLVYRLIYQLDLLNRNLWRLMMTGKVIPLPGGPANKPGAGGGSLEYDQAPRAIGNALSGAAIQIAALAGVTLTLQGVFQYLNRSVMDLNDRFKTEIDRLAEANPAIALAKAKLEISEFMNRFRVAGVMQDKIVALMNKQAEFLGSSEGTEFGIITADLAAQMQELDFGTRNVRLQFQLLEAELKKQTMMLATESTKEGGFLQGIGSFLKYIGWSATGGRVDEKTGKRIPTSFDEYLELTGQVKQINSSQTFHIPRQDNRTDITNTILRSTNNNNTVAPSPIREKPSASNEIFGPVREKPPAGNEIKIDKMNEIGFDDKTQGRRWTAFPEVGYTPMNPSECDISGSPIPSAFAAQWNKILADDGDPIENDRHGQQWEM